MPRKVPKVRIDVDLELARRLTEEQRLTRPRPTMTELVKTLLLDALNAADFRRVHSRAGQPSPVILTPSGAHDREYPDSTTLRFMPDPHRPPEPLEPEPEEPHAMISDIQIREIDAAASRVRAALSDEVRYYEIDILRELIDHVQASGIDRNHPSIVAARAALAEEPAP